MTDPKHPAVLAAERWFATDQTKSDLAQSARCLVKGWVDDTLRSIARIAFVAGYEAGRKARGATAAASWTARAEGAINLGDDTLARAALQRKVEISAEVQANEESLVQQRKLVEELRLGINTTKTKLKALNLRRGSLMAQARAAKQNNGGPGIPNDAGAGALAHFLGGAIPTPEVGAAALRCVLEMEAYFRDVIAERRKQPGEDLISAFIDGEARRFDAAAKTYFATGNTGAADRCATKAGHSRTLAAQVARGDDEREPD